MDDMQYRHDDEIDLVELFKTIWDGKLQIIGSVAVAACVAVGVLLNMPSEFTAKTEIRPITTVEADRYRESNALGFFEVDRGTLQNLFIEQLQQREVLVDAIKSLRLIDRADYETEAEYEFAVLEFADSIEILPPINEDGSARGEVRLNWSLVAEYHDEDLWVAALNQAKLEAFENIRLALLQQFEMTVAIAELQNSFEADDLRTQIENAKTDYDREIKDRLAFLREQAEVARKLGVAKNTIEAQTFGTETGFVANVQTNTPFYLRGYQAIDKEIELIESRADPEAFVNGLRDLEKNLREIEQDKTAVRARALFDKTPIVTEKKFVAVSMIVEGTEFNAKRSKVLVLVLVIMLTGMLAVIYVLISSAMRKRAEPESQ